MAADSLGKVPCLLFCGGSFNPPTIMHLRMFELARDHVEATAELRVVGAIASPVHDAYGKAELLSAEHRGAMMNLATQSSEWIVVDDWERTQPAWCRTVLSLRRSHKLLQSYLHHCARDEANDSQLSFKQYFSQLKDGNLPPDSGREQLGKVLLLCGADVLKSFAVPHLWSAQDIDEILTTFGLVVVAREGQQTSQFIYETDVLFANRKNIHLVSDQIMPNQISSTAIRRALARRESVRYVVPDPVLSYIQVHQLYGR